MEGMIWLLVPIVGSLIASFCARRLGLLAAAKRRRTLLASSVVAGVSGFLFGPRCMCRSAEDLFLGSVLFAALWGAGVHILISLIEERRP